MKAVKSIIYIHSAHYFLTISISFICSHCGQTICGQQVSLLFSQPVFSANCSFNLKKLGSAKSNGLELVTDLLFMLQIRKP